MAVDTLRQELHEAEERLLAELRQLRRGMRAETGADKPAHDLTIGQKIADTVAATMGSWNFIIIQSVLLAVWIVLNVTAFVEKWDPYPFILLNLAFSTQAAYAAPLILLAQNRQDDRDRANIERDREVAARTQADTEYLARELAAVRLALADVVTTQDLEDSLSRLVKLIVDRQESDGPNPLTPEDL